MIDRPFLSPTPFDADPPAPIVLVPAWHTPFTVRTARELARRLPLKRPPDGTVRWHTHGLDAALADPEGLPALWRPGAQPADGRVERLHGLIALLPGRPAEAKEWAVQAGRLDTGHPHRMDYTYLGGECRGAAGEIQIFGDFRRRVGVARRARADVLARPDAPADPAELRPLVWDRHGEITRADDGAARRPPRVSPRRVRRGRGRRTR